MPMKVAVFGCGYMGAVHAACIASLGHEVIGVDVLEEQVATLADGRAPFHEPGFPELLRGALDTGRLSFTTDVALAASVDGGFADALTIQLPPHLRSANRGFALARIRRRGVAVRIR